MAYLHNLDYLQLVTWNDFGEGTQLEPTAEEGFFYLDLIQQYTEINRDVLDLESIEDFYYLSKEISGGTEIDMLYRLLIEGDYIQFRYILSEHESAYSGHP